MQTSSVHTDVPNLPSELLTAAKEEYRNNGYAVIPDVWSVPEIRVAAAALENILESAARSPELWIDHILWQRDIPAGQLASIPEHKLPQAGGQVHIVSDIAAHSASLKEIVIDRRCISVAQCFLGDDVDCHFSNATIRAAEIGCCCKWHRDWPNSYCTTRDGKHIRIMICLDGMQSGQGATRVIPGSQHWSREAADEWCKRNVPLEATGEVLLCTPGSLVILGPTIIHGAEANLSAIPRRNLIMQWGRISDLFCVESPESLTGYVPSELSYPGDRTENFVPAGMIAMREASFTYPT